MLQTSADALVRVPLFLVPIFELRVAIACTFPQTVLDLVLSRGGGNQSRAGPSGRSSRRCPPEKPPKKPTKGQRCGQAGAASTGETPPVDHDLGASGVNRRPRDPKPSLVIQLARDPFDRVMFGWEESFTAEGWASDGHGAVPPAPGFPELLLPIKQPMPVDHLKWEPCDVKGECRSPDAGTWHDIPSGAAP
ncbi:hypothetical protein BSKO_02422 [Bryopsis sp. KO-2023]|nr:hypothetical protein BSKO_02422 [Bryopsis sp. KO-2023]